MRHPSAQQRTPVPLRQATGLIRKMRGPTQSHLLDCKGQAFVTKFQNNPDGSRILIAEYLATGLLQRLGIAVPRPALVEVGDELLSREPGIGMVHGTQGVRPVGLHFGTQFPGNPAVQSVYDYLPDKMLSRIANIEDFVGTFVFDHWCANGTPRSAIFFRTAAGSEAVFRCQVLHNRGVFGGIQWGLEHVDCLQSAYFRPLVYDNVRDWSSFEPWLEKVRTIPPSFLEGLVASVPQVWLRSNVEADELARLFDKLIERRTQVPCFISKTLHRSPSPLRHWAFLESSRVTACASRTASGA